MPTSKCRSGETLIDGLSLVRLASGRGSITEGFASGATISISGRYLRLSVLKNYSNLGSLSYKGVKADVALNIKGGEGYLKVYRKFSIK